MYDQTEPLAVVAVQWSWPEAKDGKPFNFSWGVSATETPWMEDSSLQLLKS